MLSTFSLVQSIGFTDLIMRTLIDCRANSPYALQKPMDDSWLRLKPEILKTVHILVEHAVAGQRICEDTGDNSEGFQGLFG